MIRSRFILLITGFLLIHIIARSGKEDSLKNIIIHSKDDTAKVSALNVIAWQFGTINPDSEIYYALKAQALAERLKDDMGTANAILERSIATLNLQKIDSALALTQKALKIYNMLLEKYPAPKRLAERSRILRKITAACLNLGTIYNYQGNYQEALLQYKTGLKIAEELKYKPGSMRCYGNIANTYANLGNYPEALVNFFACLKLSEELGDKPSIALSYGNIGLVYWRQRNYPDALKMHFISLKFWDELGEKQGIARSWNDIGLIYQEQHKVQDALKCFDTALIIYKEIGDKAGMSGCYGNLAIINKERGNYPEALKFAMLSLQGSQEIGYKEEITNTYNLIGEICFLQKKFSDAALYLNKGLNLAKESGSIQYLRDAYKGLASLDSARGNFNRALADYKLYDIYRDSLVNNANLRKSAQLQMQYDFDKKEAGAKAAQDVKDAVELRELQKQKLARNILIAGIIALLIITFLLYRNYQVQHKLRLNDIRNRIAGDLHDDIGSTLNSISVYSEVAKKKGENFEEALDMIGDASRKIIDAMSDIVWSINAENDSFEKIIFRMESLAYNLFRAKNIEFIFHADEALNEKKLQLEDRRNFYLIFKEAVNNLVKYSGATRASISLTLEDNRIKLNIRDNGMGFDTSQPVAGNGLKNMKRRANEMKAEFRIESQKGSGTQINLLLKS